MVYIRHRLFRLDVKVLSHIPHARLCSADENEKQFLLDLRRLQVLFGNVVLPFSGSTINHGNLVSLGIPAYAAAEAARQTDQVSVVEGLVGTG